MKNHHPVLLLAILALAAAAPFSNAQAQQLSESRLAQILKRFPQADTDKDGKLTAEEFKAARKQFRQSRQGNARPAAAAKTKMNSIFNTEEILDENTLETKTLQDWHPVGATRQKLIEINVAQWWPGQDYRIPVRLIVPLEGKAKGFSITGANPYETLMKDARPTAIQAKLLAGGVGIVKTHVKAFRQIPGKRGLEQKMRRVFLEDLNPRYTTLWIWSMTLMRATTAAYAQTDYFEKGKVAGSGNSKNGISPAVALINDERFTATCSDHAFAYYSPTRRADREELAKANAANKAFFEAVKAGDIELEQQRGKIYQRVMVGSENSMDKMALKTGRSMDEMQTFADRLWSSVCVAENWDRLMERGVDILFQPGTHDYVAYDILWGAQNHPQLPVYYKPSGGHSQTPHVAAAKDEQNRDAFLWNHFFGGESLLSPPASSHKVDKDKLSVRVSFDEGPQSISGRIWWIYDRAPAGSAPFLHAPIPEDQWADMERDPKTGSWTATIPLQEGASRVDFFTNHGHMSNGYQQYLSSPYTRVELSLSQKRSRQVGDAALNKALEEINGRFKNVDVELLEWPGELHEKLGKMKKLAFVARPVEKIEGKLPLLISLHGGGQRWWNMSLQEQLAISAPGGKIEKLRGFKKLRGYDLAELAGKGMILLEPNTTGLWDADSLDTMLDYVLANYPEIDKDRVYVMGYSMGGRGAWAWINESADRFAAAAPCGFNPADTGDVKKLVKLPIWAMAGGADGDRTTGVRKMVERLRAAGNVNVKHTEFEGEDHRAGLKVFSSVELVEWMLGFSRGK
jgi:predicted esterase